MLPRAICVGRIFASGVFSDLRLNDWAPPINTLAQEVIAEALYCQSSVSRHPSGFPEHLQIPRIVSNQDNTIILRDV